MPCSLTNKSFKINNFYYFSGNIRNNHVITFSPQQNGMVEIYPSPQVNLEAGAETRNVTLQILGKHPGYLDILSSISPQSVELR